MQVPNRTALARAVGNAPASWTETPIAVRRSFRFHDGLAKRNNREANLKEETAKIPQIREGELLAKRRAWHP